MTEAQARALQQRADSTAPQTIVGIDPGTVTGLAVVHEGEIISTQSLDLFDAMDYLHDYLLDPRRKIDLVVVEDTRALPIYDRHRRKGLARNARDRLCRAVGGIDRDCALWSEWLSREGFRYEMWEPGKGAKWDAKRLKLITGYTAPSNQHVRDAIRAAWTRVK